MIMDIENILYSLVPLILIIVFSWLFSFLGSRMKKQAVSIVDSGLENITELTNRIVEGKVRIF